jgi:formate hydrogenlyase subunit 6/NADH:ubiquinone oxidoreductase subunit I
MRLPKVREVVEAMKALVTGPYTSKFPKKPHVPYASFRGQPKFNDSRCVGCLACEEVCPVDAIGHRDDLDRSNPKRTLIHYTDTCIFCGQCESVCIADHEGIKLSLDWELSFFDRAKESFETIEKKLVLCEICGAAIACEDHLLWITEKIGELTFSNPTLFEARLKTLGLIDPEVAMEAATGSRSDRTKMLCARCRRKTTQEGQADKRK